MDNQRCSADPPKRFVLPPHGAEQRYEESAENTLLSRSDPGGWPKTMCRGRPRKAPSLPKPYRLLGLLGTLILGCDAAPIDEVAVQLNGRTMGTTFSLQIVDEAAASRQDAIEDIVLAVLSSTEQLTSTYLPESELSRLNAAKTREWIPLSDELCRLLKQAQALSTRTRGAFDVTVGRLVDLWGFGTTGIALEPPPNTLIERALQSSGRQYLELDCQRGVLRKGANLKLDLSAFAKGYAVDRVADALLEQGYANFLIEIGGELRAHGLSARRKPWSIAIESPSAERRSVHSVLQLDPPAAVATSGDYRNFFEHDGVRYSHTLDPRTGRPVTHDTASVTVIARSAALADGIATALLVLGAADGLELAKREAVAACFLSRAQDGFVEECTPDF